MEPEKTLLHLGQSIKSYWRPGLNIIAKSRKVHYCKTKTYLKGNANRKS